MTNPRRRFLPGLLVILILGGAAAWCAPAPVVELTSMPSRSPSRVPAGDRENPLDRRVLQRIAATSPRVDRRPADTGTVIGADTGDPVTTFGIVYDESTSEPLPGVRVQLILSPHETRAAGERDFRRMFADDHDSVVQVNGTPVEVTRSGIDGRFHFSPQRPGRFRLVADCEGYGTVTLDVGSHVRELPVGLAPGATLTGCVHGLSGAARVELCREAGGSRTVRVDGSGEYVARGLEPGRYRVRLRRDGSTRYRGGAHRILELTWPPDIVLYAGAEAHFDLNASEATLRRR